MLVAEGYIGVAGAQDAAQTAKTKDRPVPPASYAPPKGWNALEDEWVISYVRSKSPSVFRLHCALQVVTGRMFVHASELDDSGMPMPTNIQVLGLQLSNYAPQGAKDSDTWEDCIQNERTLEEMFREFVLQPLWQRAAKDHEIDTEDTDGATAGSPDSVGVGPRTDASAHARTGAFKREYSLNDVKPATTRVSVSGHASTAAAGLPTTSVLQSYLTQSPALGGLLIGCALVGIASYYYMSSRHQQRPRDAAMNVSPS